MKAAVEKLWLFIDRFVYLILIRCLHLHFLEEKWEACMQFLKFCIVGVSNTLVSYVVYLIGIMCGMYYLWASVLGFVISMVHSFYWNNTFVFASDDSDILSMLKKFIKTFVAYAFTGLILANILLVIQVQYLGIPEIIAPLINLLVTIPLNFILNKLWAFRKTNP